MAVVLYMGRPLTELSKEELIEVVGISMEETKVALKALETVSHTYQCILAARRGR